MDTSDEFDEELKHLRRICKDIEHEWRVRDGRPEGSLERAKAEADYVGGLERLVATIELIIRDPDEDRAEDEGLALSDS